MRPVDYMGRISRRSPSRRSRNRCRSPRHPPSWPSAARKAPASPCRRPSGPRAKLGKIPSLQPSGLSFHRTR